MGALSSNNEIKKAVREVKQHITNKGCWVFDRGGDNSILKDFFFSECSQAIIRLKKNTKLFHKKEDYQVNQPVKKIAFSITQTVVKTKKDKQVLEHYQLGAIPINYTIKGVTHALWLVVSRNKRHGGSAIYLLKANLPQS
jgi:hypothetical protein